jgi:hypothetical protein
LNGRSRWHSIGSIRRGFASSAIGWSASWRNWDDEGRRLAEAIGLGGTLAPLVERLRACEAQREAIQAQLATIATAGPGRAGAGLERRLRDHLDNWRTLLTQDVTGGRDVLRQLLVGPLRFTPIVDGHRRGYQFSGTLALDRLLAGVIELPDVGVPDLPAPVSVLQAVGSADSAKTHTGVASLTGFEPVFWP